MLYLIELRARFELEAKQMAERRGFEPPDRFYPINRLAGGCLQPLGHLSASSMAEGVGFEPTEPCGSAVVKTAALNHSAIPPPMSRKNLRWSGRGLKLLRPRVSLLES